MLALYPGLWGEGLVHIVSHMPVINIHFSMQRSKMASMFKSSALRIMLLSHLQLAKGVQDIVRERREAGLHHNR